MVRVTVVCKIPLLARATIGYLVRIQVTRVRVRVRARVWVRAATPNSA